METAKTDKLAKMAKILITGKHWKELRMAKMAKLAPTKGRLLVSTLWGFPEELLRG